MTRLEAALAEVVSVLDGVGIPYALIGGLAVSLWGEVRATLDIDLALWVNEDRIPETVNALCARLAPLPKDPVGFVQSTRVLPVMTSQGVRADLIFGALPAERELVERARERDARGLRVRVASLEDLLLTKLASERQRDYDDARRLLKRFGASLDAGYLRPRAEALAEALARADILRLLDEHVRS